jgi:ABC-type antimicrobial peptide transport system permease subunit
MLRYSSVGAIIVLATAVFTIACVAIGAVLGPARRAMSVDPVESLRHE